MRFLKVLGLVGVIGIMGVTGCTVGHYNLTFQYEDTVSKKATHEFVIEKTTINDTLRGILGNKALIGSDYSVEIDKCIAQAIKTEYPEANVTINDKFNDLVRDSIGNVIYIYNIRDFSIKGGFATNFVTRFTGDIQVNGKSISIKTEGGSGFLPFTGSMQSATEKACKNFAKQIKEIVTTHKKAGD